jgi:anti-sigma B factor antagonist
MGSARAPFEVARSDAAVYIRIHGLGSMKNASTLEVFTDQAIDDGARQFVIDFAACDGVDSTFMGLLLTISNRLREVDPNGGEGAPGCVLVNVDDHARKQLSSVGVDAFVLIRDKSARLPRKLRLTELPQANTSDRDRLKLMLRAHRELVAADERNRAKFGPFLDAIVAELE